jgi:hypothetical protein
MGLIAGGYILLLIFEMWKDLMDKVDNFKSPLDLGGEFDF